MEWEPRGQPFYHREDEQEEEEEQEEQEEEGALLRRQSRHNTAQPIGTAEEHAPEAEKEKQELDNAGGHEEDGVELHKTSVYFDTQQGNESANEYFGMKNVEDESVVLETNLKDEKLHMKCERIQSTDTTHENGNESVNKCFGMKNVEDESDVLETDLKDEELHIKYERIQSADTNENGKSLEDEIILSLSLPMVPMSHEKISINAPTDITHETGKNLEDGILSSLSLPVVQMSHEEISINLGHLKDKTGEDADVDLIEDVDQELTEIDVEMVLKKQNTHDLYCPNCNSCITRRVILRRKNPKVRRPKRVRSDIQSVPDTNPAYATNGADPGTFNHSNDAPTHVADDENHDKQRVAFRCLSCFSIFFPTVPASKKSWFDSLFVSDSRKADVDQGTGTAKPSEVDGISQHNSSCNSDHTLSGHENDHSVAPPDNRSPAETRAVEEDSLVKRQEGRSTSTLVDSQKAGRATVDSFIKEPIPYSGVSSDVRQRVGDSVINNKTGDDVTVNITETPTLVDHRQGAAASAAPQWDILKSIVYGGLVESITSIGVVSSAAAAGASTLNILALALANLIGGLLIIVHNLRELRNDRSGETEHEDRYEQQLGRRGRFSLHATVAILSFLIFGLVPPVVYAFSFRKSDNVDYKLAAVAGSSLACIFLLALGKAHVQTPPKSYIKTILYYISLAVTSSGVCYVVGDLVKKLMEKLHWFESSTDFMIPYQKNPGWESY